MKAPYLNNKKMKKTKYSPLVLVALLLSAFSSVEFINAQGFLLEGSFCEMVSQKLSSRTDKQPASKDSEIELKQREQTVDSRRSQRDESKEKTRNDQDEKRSELYGYLVSIAETAEQKNAAEEFKSTMDTAVVSYREKQDSIISEFRTKADELYFVKKTENSEDKPGVSKEEKEQHKSEADALFEEAQRACEAGERDEEELAQEFREKMMEITGGSGPPPMVGGKQMKDSGARGVQTLSPEMQSLVDEKKQLMREAKEAFEMETRAAKEKLLEAFK